MPRTTAYASKMYGDGDSATPIIPLVRDSDGKSQIHAIRPDVDGDTAPERWAGVVQPLREHSGGIRAE